jgi:hypothetical protein
MIDVLVAALLLGGISTIGDFIWAELKLHNRVVLGLIHGGVLCLFIGAVVGARARQMFMGAAIGPFIGVFAAAGYYALAPALGWGAMLPMWMFFWFCFALMGGVLRGGESVRIAALRGVLAAVLSGVAFYAISGIWTHPSPGGPNYVRHFLSWTFAFFPGFAALFAGRPDRGAASGICTRACIVGEQKGRGVTAEREKRDQQEKARRGEKQ